MKRLALVCALLAAACQLSPGAEPAANVNIDQAFQQLAAYDYGQDDKPLRAIELYVARAAKDPAGKAQVAERLAAVLADPKCPAGAKVFACQQLLVVGTEAQVPLLAKMLDDPKTAEIARYTLETIPGEASLAAIRGAAERWRGPALVGAINSLGIRRDAKAIGLLARHLAGPSAEVAAASAESLGKIGTPEAAAALAKADAPAGAQNALVNARLQCAERLAAAGDPAGAAAIYEQVWQSKGPAASRVAGLAGLCRVAKEQAAPRVLAALADEDPLVQATALRLSAQLPGPQVTVALAERLGKLDAAGRVLLLGALAERGDRSAAQAVARLIDDKDEAVRVAAILATGSLGDAAAAERLAKLAAAQSGAVQQAARVGLARLRGAAIEPKLLALAGAGETPVRVEAIRALGARRASAFAPVMIDAATDPEAPVRAAAFAALAAAAGPESYARLVALLARVAPEDAAAEQAVSAVGARVENPQQRVAFLVAALASEQTKPGARPAILRVLAGFGGAQALEAVCARLTDADANVRDAAVRALAAWPDASAAPELLKIAQASEVATHRVLALRGYLRLAGEIKDAPARLKMVEQIRPIATTKAAKLMLLAALAEAPDPGALHVAASFVDDPDARAEAAMAVLTIGRALARTEPAAVRGAMKKLMDTTKDKAVAEQAAAIDEEAQKAPSPEAAQLALQHDPKRSAAAKASLARRPPQGFHLACYLDCGPDAADGAKGGPLLRLVGGTPYYWPESAAAADPRFGSVFFDGQRVVFEVAGLNPKRAYQIGFSWWDFDHGTRAQSVLAATGRGERETVLLAKTALPSGAAKQGPDAKTLPVPKELYAGGTLRISFRNEGQPNVVVSELWLWESDAEGQAAAPVPARLAPAGTTTLATVAFAPGAEPADGPKPNILLVTGQEYHDWKATAPALAAILRKDPRLRVKVVEDPRILADPSIHQYDAIVLNWMNWQAPSPGPEARENFKKYLAGGKGVFMMHFACGAWQDWPEFREIVARVWDPKLRGHDPRGKFRVEITGVKHPITAGLKAFEADDELYTCLTGDRPIEVLATATSKVDGKVYPMAFVCQYGKGRVYQCMLGHDVKAMEVPGAGELFRRGCAWAAGLPAVEEKKTEEGGTAR